MTTAPLLHAWNMNLGYARRLVADVADAHLAVQPAPGMNHAAWVLGHLACTADMLGAMMGLSPVCPGEWTALFDWNSTPVADAGRYPSKAELLAALEEAHGRIAAALPAFPASRWSDPTPSEAIRAFLPTMGDCFVFVMAAHENMHLGQLSAWRRVQGMGRV
ncbi:MAG: DinB family protein [Planctomycetia bacterium]|nr:DinB family protein [Planctomycetia bacterium]